MAEHLIRNEKVGGSTPPISSKNWSPKTEAFFLEAVDFTGVDVLEEYTWSRVAVSKFLDTLLDTLREGRLSFLEISMIPDLLKSSNPPLSAIRESFYERLSFFVSRIIIGRLPDGY